MPQLHKMQLCFHILASALKVLNVFIEIFPLAWLHFSVHDHPTVGWIHSNPMGWFYYIEYLLFLNPHAAYISVSKFQLVYFSFFSIVGIKILHNHSWGL